MKHQNVIWHNGTFVKPSAANVPVLSHALHYGSGVFEGIRVYETPRGPAIFRLRDHIDRLFRSASAFGMHIPYRRDVIERAAVKLVSRSGFKECYVRPIVFYGEGKMQMDPTGAKLHVFIAAWPWGKYLGDHPALSVGVSPYVRFHPKSVIPGAKISGYYATSVLARMDAQKRGFNEALLLDHLGNVAEGPGENIFMIKRGKLFAPASPSILEGITRASVIAIARDLGMPFVKKKITLAHLMAADEAFFAGTAVEIAPVARINKRRIGPGGARGARAAASPLTAKIRAAYFGATHGTLPRYRKWLTAVQ